MANSGVNVEEIIAEVNKMHLVTLQHAAEISPLVNGRTIGPDIDLVNCKDHLSKDHLNINNTELIQTSKKYTVGIMKMKSPSKDQAILNKSSPNNKFREHNSTLDFRAINSSILLREAEEQRKRSLRKQIIDLQEKHKTLLHETLQPIEERNKEERRKWLEKKRRSDSQILQKAELESARELKEHECLLENLRQHTRKQLQLISFQGISQYQLKFRNKYETIAHLLMSIDKQALMSCAEYNNKLKELIRMFEQLIVVIKSGECGPNELKTAEELCKSLENLEINIAEGYRQEKVKFEEKQREQQRKAEELAKQEQAQQLIESHQKQQPQQQQQQQQQQQAQLSNATQQTQNEPTKSQAVQLTAEVSTATSTSCSGGMGSPQFVSSERFDFYTKINTFYHEKVERVKVLQSDESMKKYRFDCQKNINIPVNAISAVSRQHIQDKYDKLYTFVTTQPTLGRDYCILLMAKKFVGQGETTISSNPQAAYPAASVVVSLWKTIPEFGQLFLAYVFKECPFLVPYFIPQKKGQSIEEYSKVLGYRVVDGQIEQQEMYLKRQTGVARLYAAVMITSGRQQDGASHPYGVEHAWRWLTNFIALDPLPDICATLIMEILQIVGSDLWAAYGKQFVKLLVFIQHSYFPRLSAVDEGGPKARLELLLGKFIREGQIQKPQGILPQGFW